MTSVTKNPHPIIKNFFSSAIYQTGRSVWALEQLPSAIGGGAKALVRQPKTLSSCHEAKYYKTAPVCAWQCMGFWQHWSRHCQRRKFRNTCVRRNIHFECSKRGLFMSLRRRHLDKAGRLLFRNTVVLCNISCLFQNTRIWDLQWQRLIFYRL